MLALLVSLPEVARAGCTEPKMAIQVEQRTQLEGQIRASVLSVGAGVGGSKESDSTWQAQLPSQSVLDNQWILYLLCQEFESGRMPGDQYCAASAAIWSKITGGAVPPDGCSQRTPAPPVLVSSTSPAAVEPQPSAEPTTLASVAAPIASLPAAPPALAAHSSEPNTSAHHWVSPPGSAVPLELFGPVDDDGKAYWYRVESRCVGIIADGAERLFGGTCGTLGEVELTETDGALHAVARNLDQVLQRADHDGPATPSGLWRAEFFSIMGKQSVVLDFGDPRGVGVRWPDTGCKGAWIDQPTDFGPWTLQEELNVPTICPNRAVVTITPLSSDALLLTWEKGITRSVGVARPQ